MVCLAILPVAVVASDCPTAADMDRQGILLERKQPFFSAAFRRENGTLTERRRLDPGATSAFLVTQYVNGLMPGTQQRANTRASMRYTPATADLATLPGRPLDFRVTVQRNGSVLDRNGQVSLRHEGAGTVRIGRCRYPVWRVRVTTTVAGDTTVFVKDYAPDLDMVLRATRIDPSSGAGMAVVAFDRITRAPAK